LVHTVAVIKTQRHVVRHTKSTPGEECRKDNLVAEAGRGGQIASCDSIHPLSNPCTFEAELRLAQSLGWVRDLEEFEAGLAFRPGIAAHGSVTQITAFSV
jgi:hypothetical protein